MCSKGNLCVMIITIIITKLYLHMITFSATMCFCQSNDSQKYIKVVQRHGNMHDKDKMIQFKVFHPSVYWKYLLLEGKRSSFFFHVFFGKTTFFVLAQVHYVQVTDCDYSLEVILGSM